VSAVMGTFFLIWTIVWGGLYACLIPGKGIFDKGAFVKASRSADGSTRGSREGRRRERDDG
jgi:hypothetical protein